ncbi:MAG: hypothetical protein R3D43_15195 [Tepidamorphaceae bacterium]
MADTKTYNITDKAGPYVAGQRVTGKKTIKLTEEQARYELLAGSITDPAKEKEAKTTARKTGSKDTGDQAAAE